MLSKDTLDNFINKNNLADESLINFLKDANYGTKDLANYQQYLKDTGKATSSFTSFTQKATTVLKSLGAAMASMAINWVIGEIISAAITLYDNLAHKVEKANEAMSSSISEYETAKSELESINSELDEQNKKLDELSSKDKLTYAEKGQLEELQEITKELMLQQDIAERNAERASKEAADRTVKAYETQYGKYDISKERISALTGQDNFPMPDSSDDISTIIAAYIKATEKFNESREELQSALRNGDDTTWPEYNVQHYTDIIEEMHSILDSNISDLQEKRLALEEEYNKAIEKRENDLTPLSSSEQAIIDSYEAIYDSIKMVYEYTNQNAWNDIELANIFNADGIEKTKDELIAMAKAGELSPETISNYENLNRAIQNSELFLKDDKTAAESFCEEIYACVKASEELADVIEEDPTFNISSYEQQLDNIQSAISTLLSALNSLSSGDLTENEIIDLVQQFPDLAPYIDLAADGFGNLSEGLRTLIAQQPEPLIADLESLKSSLSTDEERRKVDLLIGSLRELGGVGSWFTTSDDLFGSFQSVIDSVSKDDPFKEIGQSLLDLAEQGRLTVDTFHETDSIGYFESLGISADEAVARINRLVDESRQLSSMSDQISKMADALGTKRENGFVEDDTLAGFDVEVRGLESWDRFQETLGSTASSYEECREAASALATEWVNSGDFLAQLTEQNREYYATQLEAMGVENYEEVISYAQALNEAKEALSQSSLGLGQATQDEIEALIAEGTYSGLAADMILALYDAKIAEMAATIDTSTDCANLIALAGDTDATSQSIQLLIQLMDIYSGLESGVYDGNASLREEASKKAAEIKSQLEEIANRENNAVTIEPKIKLGSRGKSSARSAGKAAGKSVKDGMKEELSNMNSVISYIGNIIGKQISKLNDQKEAAIDALEAQKKAAEEALEAEKKAIQEKIDAKQDEIDAIEEAAKARKNEIDLQKAQYELERMQSQRTKLVNYVPDAIVI